ncbi:hypothetical protein EWE75_07060 [Sphingomonas populi]|uniref:Uncharacterized protein n=1 Tax=Sphingomonas populi TaxID=2484750 RepID=A0A4Q6XY68_9SPHN|nr:hypothetical protein EWE75_07060 [Sphingomonas populi]
MEMPETEPTATARQVWNAGRMVRATGAVGAERDMRFRTGRSHLYALWRSAVFRQCTRIDIARTPVTVSSVPDV